jgi:hypothetical protein
MKDENPMLQLSHAAGELKLAYIFQADPNPIRASPKQGNPSVCDLRVIVSRRRMDTVALLKQITIAIPVGEDSGPALSAEKLPQPRLVTPGDWLVETSDDRTIVIRSTKSDTGLSFSESSLVFVLPGIRINSEPGLVALTLKEQDSDGEWSSGRAELTKLDAAFVVEHFYADQPIVNSRGAKVKLFWRCSDKGAQYSFGLRGNGWPARDCLNDGNCYTAAQGLAGIQTNDIDQTCTFRLDVIRAEAGGGKIIGTLETTVQMAPVSIAQDSYLEFTPSGRIARVGWIAFNAVRCSIRVNAELYDDNAPCNTIAREKNYFMVLGGAKGESPRIQIVAHGASGFTASLLFVDRVKLDDPALLQPWDQGFSDPRPDLPFSGVIEPRAGGGTVVLIMPEIVMYRPNSKISVVDVQTRAAVGTTVTIVNASTTNVFLVGDAAIADFGNEVIQIDLAARKVVKRLKVPIPIATGNLVRISNQDRALLMDEQHISIVDLKSFTIAVGGKLKMPGGRAIAITPDGRLAIFADRKALSFVRVEGASLTKEEGQIVVEAAISSVAISPDGTFAVVTQAKQSKIIDIAKREQVATIGAYSRAQFISNTQVLLSRENEIVVMNLATRQISKASIPASGVCRMVLCEDPLFLATTGRFSTPDGGYCLTARIL